MWGLPLGPSLVTWKQAAVRNVQAALSEEVAEEAASQSGVTVESHSGYADGARSAGDLHL